jgi:hypothetical protein
MLYFICFKYFIKFYITFFSIHHRTILAVSILSTLSHKSTTWASWNSFKSFSENHHSGQITPHRSPFDNFLISQYGSPFIFAIIILFQRVNSFSSFSDFKNFISGIWIHRDCSRASYEILSKRSDFFSFRWRIMECSLTRK